AQAEGPAIQANFVSNTCEPAANPVVTATCVSTQTHVSEQQATTILATCEVAADAPASTVIDTCVNKEVTKLIPADGAPAPGGDTVLETDFDFQICKT